MSILDDVINQTAGPRIVSENNRWTDGCHNLATSNGRISMVSALQVPWHGLGTVVDRAMTAQEAIRIANLDWPIRKIEAYVDWQDKRVATGMFAIVRGDTGDVLGTVGGRYTPLTNQQSFDFMDSIVGQGNAVFETAGALGNGSKVWVNAKLPSMQIAGEETERYVMFANSHDGSCAVSVFPTTVRTVCSNTYRLALRDRKAGISFRHTGNLRRKVNVAKNALGLANEASQEYKQKADFLANIQLEPVEYFNACLDDVLEVTIAGQPLTSKTVSDKTVLDSILAIADAETKATEEKRYARAIKRRQNLLDDILERYESDRNNGNQRIAGTAWAAYNAVSEYADHGRSYKGSDRQRAENRLVSTVMGGQADTIKQSALDRALATVA